MFSRIPIYLLLLTSSFFFYNYVIGALLLSGTNELQVQNENRNSPSNTITVLCRRADSNAANKFNSGLKTLVTIKNVSVKKKNQIKFRWHVMLKLHSSCQSDRPTRSDSMILNKF